MDAGVLQGCKYCKAQVLQWGRIVGCQHGRDGDRRMLVHVGTKQVGVWGGRKQRCGKIEASNHEHSVALQL